MLNTNKFLSVDGLGNIILAPTSNSGRIGTELWQRREVGLLQTMTEDAVVIGSGIGNIPVGYRLYVADGILTEKVKVAVKGTNE